MKVLTFLIMSFLVGSLAFARDWQKVFIPNAFCGNGSPYFVFVDKKPGDKLIMEFMGGGACWSGSTCYGPNIRTWMYPIPDLPAFSVLSSEGSDVPFKNHSMVYFPYCTGDVFAGHHVAHYIPFVNTHHDGYTNVQLAFQFLNEQVLPLKNFNEVILSGASAGAIGALIHSETIQPYLNPTAHKILIADSPGLHFGKTFWNKFTAEEMSDFTDSFSKIDLIFNPNDGDVAPYLTPVFEHLKSWDIAFLQSTRDIVMSKVFGDISPEDHEKLILSSTGLPAMAQPYSNIQTWIPHCYEHTFLLTPITDMIKDKNGESAWSFVQRFYTQVGTPSLIQNPALD